MHRGTPNCRRTFRRSRRRSDPELNRETRSIFFSLVYSADDLRNTPLNSSTACETSDVRVVPSHRTEHAAGTVGLIGHSLYLAHLF
jgi:hypothetical protein